MPKIKKPHGGRLENWVINTHSRNGFVYVTLSGNLHDDPQDRWPEGQWVTTSYIVRWRGSKVETRNTIYALGVAAYTAPEEAP